MIKMLDAVKALSEAQAGVKKYGVYDVRGTSVHMAFDAFRELAESINCDVVQVERDKETCGGYRWEYSTVIDGLKFYGITTEKVYTRRMLRLRKKTSVFIVEKDKKERVTND